MTPRLGPNDLTMVPCPADEACLACSGSRKTVCFRCPLPHTLECPGCSTCGVCQGTGMVSAERRTEWLRMNPPPEMAP